MIRILKICVFATMWLMPSTSTHLPLVLDMFKLNLKYPIIWLICLLRCIKFELNWIGIERKWIELELNWKILNPIWIRIELNWKILNPTWIGIELNWKKWIDPSPVGNIFFLFFFSGLFSQDNNIKWLFHITKSQLHIYLISSPYILLPWQTPDTFKYCSIYGHPCLFAQVTPIHHHGGSYHSDHQIIGPALHSGTETGV